MIKSKIEEEIKSDDKQMNGIIKIGIWGLTLFTALLAVSLKSYGATLHTTPDSLVYSLHFRQGGDLLMKDYRDNEQTLRAMAAAFTTENAARILKINIVGSASPEGTVERNAQLSQKRAEAVRNYILWRWRIVDRSMIEISKQTDYLSAWLRAVVQASDMPKQPEAIKILHSNASIPTKWANIQRLSTDAAKYMERHIFPYLRSAMTVIVCKTPEPTNRQACDEPADRQTDVEIAVASDPINSAVSSTVSDAEVIVTTEKTADSTTTETVNKPVNTGALATDDRAAKSVAEGIDSAVSDKKMKCKEDYRFAIKTNLLQGAVAFAPNLGVEYALNNKSTIELTGVLNNWGLDGSTTNNKKLAHWILQTEYRYWLGKSFCGHFFGVHAFGGKYNISGHTLPNLFLGGDLMESKYRYDGWMMGAGVSYGYHLRFARHWGVEFNIGIGVAHLRYDKYDCIRCGRKLNTENRTYFGPTKAGISLIYNF